MKREELIKSCSDLLYKLCDIVQSRNTLNYYDINISCEYFFIPLLNQVFDCDLKNLNTEEKNAAAIDLYDTNGKIAVQVTSNSSAEKIRTTLKKYRKNKLYEKYKRLIVVVIVRSHTYKADFTNDIGGEFSFSKNSDIYTVNSLIKEISALNVEKMASIKEYLEYQLDTLLDEAKVSTIEQSFNYISKNTNNILNESYFEIDNERFVKDFREKLDVSDVIHLSSLSVEEGKYCILNLLHKLCPHKLVYVIKSKENWEKAAKHLSNCILIPDFQADEIPVIENNTILFIQKEDNSPNALRIPQRTISFLSNKLRESGYDDPYKLLQKTHGLYYYIKIELFTGIINHPCWEKDNDKAVIVATLLGKWTESDGDKSIIEKIYGDSYDQFISYLAEYIGDEDAFVVRKRSMSDNIIYELADPFLAVCSHRNLVDLPIIKEFLDVTKTVVSERDPIFDEPFDRHFYLSAFKKSKYSYSIKSGMTRTLILLALYANYQSAISNFVRDLLKMIHSLMDWAYISQFIESLCEAAPDVVIDCFENNVDNHTGLLDLFTAEKSDILMGRHYYTNILWCLERLLSCKDYAVRAVRILFELGDKIDKCSTGNNPRDDLAKVFCTWYNVSALEIEDKIELAKMGVEKYPFFWDVLYNEIGKNTSVFCNSSFTYRKTDNVIQYTTEDLIHFYVSYTQILISEINGNLEKHIKLLDLLPNCTDELFTAIQNEITTAITKLGDSDKEQIKTTLRKIIYKHRHFANSKWAAPPERISKIEKICLGISFEDQAYDFLYLIGSGEIPILNPVLYDSEDDCYHRNKNAIKSVVVSEIERFKAESIDLGHFLGLRKIESYWNIGSAISKYYCEGNYDEKVLDTIICSTNIPQIAIDYVYSCSNSDFSEVYQAIEFLKKDHFADGFYVAFISTLPYDEKTKSLIKELPANATQIYWQGFIRFKIDSKALLIEVIENLLKYKNWHELYRITRSQKEMLNTEEIISITSKSTQKMIEEKVEIGNNMSYLIKQLLSTVYQRIGSDYENHPELLELELRLYSIIGWDNMKCCHYLFKRNANLLADIISLIYKKDDGNSDDEIETDRFRFFFRLERDIKFCPGEENGSVDIDVLNEWIRVFSNRLENQGQSFLLYKQLGKLFAYSPSDADDAFPHEVIRDKIEEIGNEELINSFASTIIYGRGVYTLTGGKDEYLLAQKYGELSKRFAVRYPKTSKIFNIISRHYLNESEHDRKIAESDVY